MKVCFLAPANNYHTKKWCKWFNEHGHDIHVVSFIDDKIPNTTVHYVNTGASADAGDYKKLKYLLKAKTVKKIVDEINPDIVNVHYATSYGTVAALSGMNGYILSVWGADVYDFPQKSFFHRCMLQYSLKKATYLFSTSMAMAIETRKYTSKEIEITPFGVDMNLFNPNKRSRQDNEFVVGTVKALTPKYGIDYLIQAVAMIKKERPDIPIKLRIAGKGEKEAEYKQMAINENVANLTTWLGYISQEECAKEWANMDVGVVYSTLDSESFGVSAVEAEACGTPVIISDIPGLMEATSPGQSSIVIKRCNKQKLFESIVDMYDDKSKRVTMGIKGREFATARYDIDECFYKVEKVFTRIQREKSRR